MSLTRLKAILQITSAKLDEKEDDDFVCDQMKYLIQCFNEHGATTAGYSDEHIQLAFKCLINLCSTSVRNQLLFDIFESHLTRVEFVERIKKLWLTSDKDDQTHRLAMDFLCNLSRDTYWSSSIVQDDPDGLLRFIFQSDSTLTHSLPLLLNLTSQTKIRQRLNTLARLRNRLIELLLRQAGQEVSQLVVGILKNCFFDDDYHLLWLAPQLRLLEGLLRPLCGPTDQIDDEDRKKLPVGLQQIVGRSLARRTESDELKQVICEALLQLCSTSDGRTRLRDCGTYFVLRELHKFENSRRQQFIVKHVSRSQSLNELVYLIEQVVDQLICQEEERDPDLVARSLRSINVDEETAAKLDRAKEEFICTC
ncbi:hypothetical protein FBUS_05941 [Fasciolopsis buskii]|uniref:Protein HGH1 homolog n=1 Tax=Fasciolopsis buskii TaxID=27845 RepID=A0A8E0VCN0_9TREM|nr:hypothetical protein FBUS_05941 [Fasciolopsis buski]